MFKWVFGIVIALTVLFLGLAAFPGMKSALTSDTTGLSPMNAIGIILMPYIMLAFIVYGVVVAVRTGGK